MRRILIIAASVLLVGAVPAPAVAGTRGDVRHSAKTVYRAAAKRLGKQALGRNIARHGVKTRRGERPARTGELRRWRARLAALLHPVQAPVFGATTSGAVAYREAPATSGLPACADESHGNYSTGPANTNASGATGRWQEMPVHRAKGGLCEGIDLSPAGQDACAARIFAAQGAGAWTGCG
jgi:hypothetical protein